MLGYLPPVLPNQPDFGDRGHGKKTHLACHQLDYTCRIVDTVFAPEVDVTGAGRPSFDQIKCNANGQRDFGRTTARMLSGIKKGRAFPSANSTALKHSAELTYGRDPCQPG